MANKTLFSSIKSRLKRANARNEAGGIAYQRSPREALAQLAATGTFNGTYYARGQQQLDDVIRLIQSVDDQYLAKLAVYARRHANMKDMPATILAVLSTRDTELTHQVFDRVIDNGRMLRTLFQLIRSGQFGRTGLSSSLQRAFQRWLNEASVGKLLSASIGNDPSLRDVMRMARPRPRDNQRRALFGWLTDKEIAKWAPATAEDLPREIRALIEYRQATTADQQIRAITDQPIRWDLLADCAMDTQVWKAIARQMGPQALRMNLNTLHRHGVFEDASMVDFVAGKIADEDAIKRSRQFPYQFLAAYLNANETVPHKIRQSLHAAAEIACGNVPRLPAPILIGLDVSGSMSWAATGTRGRGATSKVRCIDVAALFAAAMLRANPDSVVVPFDDRLHEAKIDPSDSILSISKRLAKYGGGGTNCALPVDAANTKYRDRKFAGIVLVSDNQSWIGSGRHGATRVLTEWNRFANQRASMKPRLVCIDIQPGTTSQVPGRADILNIGGFSDAVFKVASSFLTGDRDRFVSQVEAIEL